VSKLALFWIAPVLIALVGLFRMYLRGANTLAYFSGAKMTGKKDLSEWATIYFSVWLGT
jgi:hypothetical protein